MSAGTVPMPRKKRNDAVTKIDAEVLRKARHVCNHRDISLAEYLTETLRPLVDRDFDSFVKAQQQPKPKPRD